MNFGSYNVPPGRIGPAPMSPVYDADSGGGRRKKIDLDPEVVESVQTSQALPSNLAIDLNQAIYYNAAEKKLSDKIIKTQLKEWLFSRFATEDQGIKLLRESVVSEIIIKLNELQKQETMPKAWDEFNETRVVLLTVAVVKVSAEVAVRGDDNETFKLEMLRSFLREQ